MTNKHPGSLDLIDVFSGGSVPDFDGGTYNRARDHARLGQQMRDVYTLFRDGKWRTLKDASNTLGHPEASISSRLRDFRKRKFISLGRWMESEHIEDGLWRYRLVELDAAELTRKVQEEEDRVEALKHQPDDLSAIERALQEGNHASVIASIPALIRELRGLRKKKGKAL